MRNGRAPAGFRPNGWPFGLQSRSRLGTFEPAKNLESGEVLALGGRLVCRADLVWEPLNPLKAWRVERYWRWATHAKQQSPTAGFQPNGWPFGLQRRSRLGTFEPAKNLESGEVLALGNPCETAEPLQDSGPMGGRLVAWRVERYWRWATHAKQQSPTAGFQSKGWPFGLQRRSRLGAFEPLKAWRYRRWATHAKQQSPCSIQAQWVAVWSAEPISFGRL